MSFMVTLLTIVRDVRHIFSLLLSSMLGNACKRHRKSINMYL